MSPSLVRVNGRDVDANDLDQKRKVNRAIDDISDSGRVVYNEKGVELKRKGSEFLLSVFPKELDESGRFSPIAFYGSSFQKGAAGSVITKLKSFANHIGRTFDEETINAVSKAFSK